MDIYTEIFSIERLGVFSILRSPCCVVENKEFGNQDATQRTKSMKHDSIFYLRISRYSEVIFLCFLVSKYQETESGAG